MSNPSTKEIAIQIIKSYHPEYSLWYEGNILELNETKAIESAIKSYGNQKLDEAIELAEGYDSYEDLPCGDSGHDDRWCGHCESKNDGADIISQNIRALKENI
mgnify:CR=1 FL=1